MSFLSFSYISNLTNQDLILNKNARTPVTITLFENWHNTATGAN